jgi:hypothetical protein
MGASRLLAWVSAIDRLTTSQRAEALEALSVVGGGRVPAAGVANQDCVAVRCNSFSHGLLGHDRDVLR